ncbi:MAG: PspA/IM30 family protein [Pontiella sp.]
MGIFTRFRDIMGSNIDAMLDQAEYPIKTIKMMVSEMEDTLIELKSSCANVIANCKKLDRRQNELLTRLKLWSNRAELATNNGNDELAREALQENHQLTEQVKVLKNELKEINRQIDQYKHDITALESKLNHARDKK